MLNRTNIIILLIALIGAIGGFFAGQRMQLNPEVTIPNDTKTLKVGDRRVDFQMSDLEGHSRRISEWDGKLLLVNFWATWCSPCRTEMPLLDKAQNLYSTQGLQVVGVALDDMVTVQGYLKESPVNYPILLGTDAFNDLGLLYGNTRGVLPYSVLIGHHGRVLAQRAGEFNTDSLDEWLRPYL